MNLDKILIFYTYISRCKTKNMQILYGYKSIFLIVLDNIQEQYMGYSYDREFRNRHLTTDTLTSTSSSSSSSIISSALTFACFSFYFNGGNISYYI